MTVSVDDRDEYQYQEHGYGNSGAMPVATNGRSEKKSDFVGGFVNGLRRIPKVISKSRLRDHGKPERQGTESTASSTTETGRIALPRYTGPSMPGIAASNSDDIPTVERLETSLHASSVSPHPRHAIPAESSDISIGDTQRERLLLSAVCEHEFEHTLHPSLHPPHSHSNSDDTSTPSRSPFEREGDPPNAMSTPILADASIRVINCSSRYFSNHVPDIIICRDHPPCIQVRFRYRRCQSAYDGGRGCWNSAMCVML